MCVGGGGVRWEQRPRGYPGREAKERRPHLSRGRNLFVTIEVFSPVLFRVAMEHLKCSWCGCILGFIYIEIRMAPVSLDSTGWRGSGEGHAQRDIPLPCRRQVAPSSWALPMGAGQELTPRLPALGPRAGPRLWGNSHTGGWTLPGLGRAVPPGLPRPVPVSPWHGAPGFLTGRQGPCLPLAFGQTAPSERTLSGPFLPLTVE